jgi:putative iron-only hydrogenase system regulator
MYQACLNTFDDKAVNLRTGRSDMETRIAMIGIIIEDIDATGKVNDILHDYSMYVIGRMGIPYRERDISIISIALDAPADVINTLAGKLGKVSGVSVKTMYSRIPEE